jgi:anti-sigma factor RsiW
MSTRDHGGDNDELIQRYLDGELDAEEQAKVARLLMEDPRLRRTLEEYRQLGLMLREAAGMEEARKVLESSFDGIRRKAMEPGGTSFWETFKITAEEFILHRKRVWIPAAAAAVVALSTTALVLWLAGRPSPAAFPSEEKWSRVTSISLGANSSMVMEVEDEAGTKTAVFWVFGDSEAQAPEENGAAGQPTQDAATEGEHQ